ncbi:hypothetical protein M9434_003279 [Picochlorum sp. BPE23]|nr:hypothetical protein M9434_003279 [Picochlorum sp. BPE23]
MGTFCVCKIRTGYGTGGIGYVRGSGLSCDVLPSVREEPFDRPVLDTWVDTLEETRIAPGGNDILIPLNKTTPIFIVYDESFRDLLGADGSNTVPLETVAEKNYSFAHEGPVWLESLNSLFFTSNRLGNTTDSDQYVEMWLLEVDSGNLTQLDVPVPMANGATLYGNDNVLVLSQGANTTGGALYSLDPVNQTVDPLLNNWFALKFNSPNDVVVFPDGSILFTDPVYGFDQLFRNGGIELGAYIWLWKPGQAPSVLADGYVAPNGLAFSPDFTTLYASDTGFFNGTGAWNPLKPHTIYAYDVVQDDDGNFKGIENKREFYTSSVGIPDGIKVDNVGNVYTGVGSGVDVISKEGKLIGSIAVGSVANLAFGGQNMDELYMMQEDKITKLKLNTQAPDLPTTIVSAQGAVVRENDKVPVLSASPAAWPSGLVMLYMLILSSTNVLILH